MTRRELERIQQQLSRSEGALEQCRKRLQAEFGVESLTDAKSLLKKEERVQGKRVAEEEKLEVAFREKWQDKLEETQ